MYNPSPAQRAIKQSAVAGTITAIATIAGGTYQYTLGHGLNVQALLVFLLPFVTGQALTLWHTLTSAPQFQQALTDSTLALPAEIRALPDALAGLHQKADALLGAAHTHAFPLEQASATPVPATPTLPGPAPQFVSPASMPVVRDSAIMAAFPVPTQQ